MELRYGIICMELMVNTLCVHVGISSIMLLFCSSYVLLCLAELRHCCFPLQLAIVLAQFEVLVNSFVLHIY